MAEERNSSEVCPGCGGGMEVSSDAFPMNGDEVSGIPHLRCPRCGEIAFTPEQLDVVYGYRIAQRNLRSDASGRLSRRGNIVDSAV